MSNANSNFTRVRNDLTNINTVAARDINVVTLNAQTVNSDNLGGIKKLTGYAGTGLVNGTNVFYLLKDSSYNVSPTGPGDTRLAVLPAGGRPFAAFLSNNGVTCVTPLVGNVLTFEIVNVNGSVSTSSIFNGATTDTVNSGGSACTPFGNDNVTVANSLPAVIGCTPLGQLTAGDVRVDILYM